MTIKVSLIHPEQRRFILAQWDDPLTGATKTKSTKTATRREAERFAARLEDELNSGEYRPAQAITWADFVSRYDAEVATSKAANTRLKTFAMFRAVERLFNPKHLESVADASFVSRFATALRSETMTVKRDGKEVAVTVDRAPYTIRGHLSELRKVLRWAKELDMIKRVPSIRMPTTTAGMKGRPITEAEFRKILAAASNAPAIIPIQFVESWRHYLEGLWLSSLRLEESMKLHWTDDSELSVDFTGKRPMLRIQAAHEKGRKFRLLPITPDFAAFLERTPPSHRREYVFNPATYPRGRQEGTHRPLAHHCGKVVCSLGKLAGVLVNETKYASAHDFRRSFGYRWSQLVMPKILQELMRHESIQTTMEFYVGSMAEDAAETVWRAFGNTSGNTSPETDPPNPPAKRKTPKK